jgi:hypothetical protein
VRSSVFPEKNIQEMSTETFSGSPMASANLKAEMMFVAWRLLICWVGLRDFRFDGDVGTSSPDWAGQPSW